MLLLLAHLALADDGGFALLRNARHRADGDIVRNISFRGNGSVLGDSPDGLLRIQMEQEESPPFILTTPVTFAAKPAEWVPGALNRDAYRLELWYAHHGWFDARFEGWEVLQVRPARVRKSGALKAAGVVDVVGYMTPGSPTTVRHLAITGYDNNVGTVVRAVLSGLDLAEGDRFDLEQVRLATDQLQAQLRERGFAFATATMSSEVFPDEHAVDVRIVIDMGSARTLSFGAITVDGLASVPEDKVRGALRLKEGQRYSLSAIEQARTRLFALGVFSSVTLDADMSDAHAERIPLAVHLTESKARTLRIGGGFQYDGVRFTPRVSSTFVHTNVAKRLVRVELEESLGYNRFTSTSRSLGSDDLLYGLRAAVSVPQFQHPKVDLSTAVTYDRDLQNGMFLYRNPQLDADVVVRTSRPSLVALFLQGSGQVVPDCNVYTCSETGDPTMMLVPPLICNRLDDSGLFVRLSPSTTTLSARMKMPRYTPALSISISGPSGLRSPWFSAWLFPSRYVPRPSSQMPPGVPYGQVNQDGSRSVQTPGTFFP